MDKFVTKVFLFMLTPIIGIGVMCGWIFGAFHFGVSAGRKYFIDELEEDRKWTSQPR